MIAIAAVADDEYFFGGGAKVKVHSQRRAFFLSTIDRKKKKTNRNQHKETKINRAIVVKAYTSRLIRMLFIFGLIAHCVRFIQF